MYQHIHSTYQLHVKYVYIIKYIISNYFYYSTTHCTRVVFVQILCCVLLSKFYYFKNKQFSLNQEVSPPYQQSAVFSALTLSNMLDLMMRLATSQGQGFATSFIILLTFPSVNADEANPPVCPINPDDEVASSEQLTGEACKDNSEYFLTPNHIVLVSGSNP